MAAVSVPGSWGWWLPWGRGSVIFCSLGFGFEAILGAGSEGSGRAWLGLWGDVRVRRVRCVAVG